MDDFDLDGYATVLKEIVSHARAAGDDAALIQIEKVLASLVEAYREYVAV